MMGQAAWLIKRGGYQSLMHLNYEHATWGVADSEAALAERLAIGRQRVSAPAPPASAERKRAIPSGVALTIIVDHALVSGVEVEADFGT